MPKPSDAAACDQNLHDVGPSADVLAVRRLMRGPLVPFVVISNGWAMGEWYGAGGGQTLFQLRHGAWSFVAGGGGAMSTYEMRKYGVPQAAWCVFGIYDAACGHKKNGSR